MKIVSEAMEVGGRTLLLESGRFAERADATILARYGDTMVLVTIVSAKPREDLDYFPLHIEYLERLYAGGRIKGSRWVKREGRPSDDAVLKARLIDRSLRPLFPKKYKKETQIIVTILSVDGENDPDVLSVIAAGAALSISDIPWDGPIGCVRIGFIPSEKSHFGKESKIKEKQRLEDQFIINPTNGEIEYSDMDLIVSATKQKIVMIEAGMNQISEDLLLKACESAKEETDKIVKLVEKIQKKVGVKKQKLETNINGENIIKKIKVKYQKELSKAILQKAVKDEESEELTLLVDRIIEELGEEFEKKQILKAIDELFKNQVREKILRKGIRLDGRKSNQIRPISAEVGFLPRTHGSAMFRRGQTQVLTVVTLASPSLEQFIESPEGEETKRYMHHYYMPPYSVGETGRLGWPSRREVGHGALAERALLSVIPNEEKFPYTIRVVSEIMSSNGSTSMAAVCGSTLSLMDAGVPITDPVSGIAIGMVSEKNRHIMLSDIIGIEDFCGDMDFKIAGTKNGVTAMQLDVKNNGIDFEILKEAVKQGRDGRLYILNEFLKVLPAPRGDISRYAPKVSVVHVPQDKIGEIIGPGGKIIRRIIAETQTSIDVEDDGTVTVASPDESMLNKAVSWIKGLIKEVKAGEVFEGGVKRILPFGAFVEIAPGKEGLVHVSQMAKHYVNNPQDVVALGDKVKVRVIEIDEQGRINLSMLFGEDATRARETGRSIEEPRKPFRRRRY